MLEVYFFKNFRERYFYARLDFQGIMVSLGFWFVAFCSDVTDET